MSNGWLIGLINWEPEKLVFLHGLGPLVALEMETGGNATSLYKELHSELQKNVYSIFPLVLKSARWLPS